MVRSPFSTGFVVLSAVIAIIGIIQIVPHILPFFYAYHGTWLSDTGNLTHVRTKEELTAQIYAHPDVLAFAITPQHGVSEIPGEITYLTNLRSLLIAGVPISGLPLEIGSFSRLTNLTIHHTPLTFLPTEIGSLPALQELDLSHNQLTDLPMEIGSLSRLTKLLLNNNNLLTIPPTIGNLTNLTSIDLRDNNISMLPESLKKLTGLRYIFLGGNPIHAETIRSFQEALPNTNIYW